MNIDYFIVRIYPKEIGVQLGLLLEVDIIFDSGITMAGFKWHKTGGWIIPKYFSYLSGEREVKPILNTFSTTCITKRLTETLTSVKLVLTSDSYRKSYIVNQKGATLMAQ